MPESVEAQPQLHHATGHDRPMRREKGILTAERKFDATAHYARPDVLRSRSIDPRSDLSDLRAPQSELFFMTAVGRKLLSCGISP